MRVDVWENKSHPFVLIDSKSLGTISLSVGLQMLPHFPQRTVIGLTSHSGEGHCFPLLTAPQTRPTEDRADGSLFNMVVCRPVPPPLPPRAVSLPAGLRGSPSFPSWLSEQEAQGATVKNSEGRTWANQVGSRKAS